MNENLFFKSNVVNCQNRRCKYSFLIFILLFLLCAPQSFNATALETDSLLQKNKSVIYVGENTIIYGVSNISNTVVLEVKEKTNGIKGVEFKKKDVPLRIQIVSGKGNQNRKLKELQKKINKQVKNTFYIGLSNRDFIRLEKSMFASLATPLPPIYKYAKAILSIGNVLNLPKIYSVKQKFYTFLSYSELGNLINSFLRGPPHFI